MPQIIATYLLLIQPILLAILSYQTSINRTEVGHLGEPSCGCFGKIDVSPWWTATLDAAIVGMLLWSKNTVWRGLSHYYAAKHWQKCTFIVLTWLVVAVPVAFAVFSFEKNDLSVLGTEFVGADGRRTILLEPEKWVGNEFPLLPYLEGDMEVLKNGQWMVIVGKLNCEECKKLLDLAIEANVPNVALLFVCEENEVETTIKDDVKSRVSFCSRLKSHPDRIILTPFALNCINDVCI